nr:MAG TPA: hypothetical protein [Caudoviricetes sp.]
MFFHCFTKSLQLFKYQRFSNYNLYNVIQSFKTRVGKKWENQM